MEELLFSLTHNSWAEILGWTLLHSIWQGLLVAALLGLTFFALPNLKSQQRFACTVVALLMLLGTSAMTLQHYASTLPESIFAKELMNTRMNETLLESATLASEPVLTVEKSFNWRALVSWIPLIWLPGILLLGMRRAGGIWYAQRIRRIGTRKVDEQWNKKLRSLSQALGLKRPPQLLLSLHLASPVVIGHLKPTILLPVSVLSGMAPEQIEAILAHELAHVARRDYLVNLLITGIETLFFFHPAVWWMANLAREEREFCCDEMAVALCGNPFGYAHALAELEANSLAQPSLAMGLLGSKKPLLNRIQRILQPDSPEKSSLDKLLITSILGLSLGLLICFPPKVDARSSLQVESEIAMVGPMISSIVALNDTPPPPPPPPPFWGKDLAAPPTLSFPFDKIDLPEGDVDKQRLYLEQVKEKWSAVVRKWKGEYSMWNEEAEEKLFQFYKNTMSAKSWEQFGEKYWREVAEEYTKKAQFKAMVQAEKVMHETQMILLEADVYLKEEAKKDQQRSEIREEERRKEEILARELALEKEMVREREEALKQAEILQQYEMLKKEAKLEQMKALEMEQLRRKEKMAREKEEALKQVEMLKQYEVLKKEAELERMKALEMEQLRQKEKKAEEEKMEQELKKLTWVLKDLEQQVAAMRKEDFAEEVGRAKLLEMAQALKLLEQKQQETMLFSKLKGLESMMEKEIAEAKMLGELAKLEELREVLIHEMKADGIINSNTKKIVLREKNRGLIVNRTKLNYRQNLKYWKIFEEYGIHFTPEYSLSFKIQGDSPLIRKEH